MGELVQLINHRTLGLKTPCLGKKFLNLLKKVDTKNFSKRDKVRFDLIVAEVVKSQGNLKEAADMMLKLTKNPHGCLVMILAVLLPIVPPKEILELYARAKPLLDTGNYPRNFQDKAKVIAVAAEATLHVGNMKLA